jgi:proteasome accessory factor C
MSTGAAQRLARLLNLVPWLLNRPGIPLAEAAQHFGISQQQLVKDLELLFVCGAPGHLPDDLIEADWESGHIYLSNADPISRPLRLTMDETVALLVGLRTLASIPGIPDHELIDTVLAKISAAAGQANSQTPSVNVDLAPNGYAEQLNLIGTAINKQQQLSISHLNPNRDETTERVVDPQRILNLNSSWYLQAWCHRAGSQRTFRLDRIMEIRPLPTPINPSQHDEPSLDDIFEPTQDGLEIILQITSQAAWILDYYPFEPVADETQALGGDWQRVKVRAADPSWVHRLILRLGGQARIEHPAALAAQVEDSARQALAGYDDTK